MSFDRESQQSPSSVDIPEPLTPGSDVDSICGRDEIEKEWQFQGSLESDSLPDYTLANAGPALVTHRGKLWCVWSRCQPSTSSFAWTSLNNQGRWSAITSSSFAQTSGFIALADLNDDLHAVFVQGHPWATPQSREYPSTESLVHVQYDHQSETWGKRACLGVPAGAALTLASFRGQLFCAIAYQDDRIEYLTWDDRQGWSPGSRVKGLTYSGNGLVFYVARDQLHLLVSDETSRLMQLQFCTQDRRWLLVSTPSEDKARVTDVKAVCTHGDVYLLYRERGSRSVLITKQSDGVVQQPQQVHFPSLSPSSRLPAIGQLGRHLVCVWPAVMDSRKSLLWSRCSLRDIPAMDTWMSHLSSDLYLSELSIPGTHESCALVRVPFVQCQHMTIAEQLNVGIRYFDFRCGVTFGRLFLFHGGTPLGFALGDILSVMYAWLSRVQSEAIILQIKMEGGTGNETVFESLIRAEMVSNSRYWALGTTIPKLGAIRGKIQLMRRFFSATGSLGIDVRRWADNSPRFAIPIDPMHPWERLVVQDQYEYTDVVSSFSELIRIKFGAVSKLVKSAHSDGNPRSWYLNWCGAYAGPISLGVVASPLDIAIGRNDRASEGANGFVQGINASLYETFFEQPAKGRCGTLLLDFAEQPTADLVSAIVLTNTLI